MHIAYVAGVPGQDKGSKTGEELDGAKQDKHHCLRACQVHPPGGDDHEVVQDLSAMMMIRMIMMIVMIVVTEEAFLTHPAIKGYSYI